MLKLLFWFLVLVNGLLFSYQKGYLEDLVSSGHEPERLQKQMNADRIKLVAASVATAGEPGAATEGGEPTAGMPAAGAPATPAPVATPAPTASAAPVPAVAAVTQDKKAPLLACVEIGNFDANDAARFAAKLTPLAFGDKLSKRIVTDSTRHIVFIPPQGSKEGADKKAGQLRNLGVKDFYVIQDNTEYRWGISLGIFSTEDAAKAQLAALSKQGVHSAMIHAYGTTTGKTAFQFRQLNAESYAGLEKIKAGFPEQQTRACAAAP